MRPPFIPLPASPASPASPARAAALLVAVLTLPVRPAFAQAGAPAATTAAASRTAPSAATPFIDLHPADGELAAQLQRGAAEARRRGLSAYVQIAADWCGPCKRLRASLGDPAMADAFRGTYVLRLDADQWKGRLGGTGLQSEAIPVFFALDPQGRATGAAIDGGAWKEDVPANMAPPLKAFFTAHAWKPAAPSAAP